jgi:hypothetical protein
MGLMDRVKAQANQLAQQTREAAQAGQQKIDQVQAQRRADAMLRQLGVHVFAERTGRGTADTQAKVDQLVTDLTAYERENGLNLTAEPAQQGHPWQQNAGGEAQQEQNPFGGGQPEQPNPFASQQQPDPFAGQQQQQPGGFGGPTFFPGSGSPDSGPGSGDQPG